MNARKKKYVPDIAELNRVCEHNFVLLARMVKSWEQAAVSQFETSQFAIFQIKVTEASKFTTHVEMRQLSASMPDLMQPKVLIRVYHDAKMAEVISSQNASRIQPSYLYPNPQMHQPDEKMQINQFLNEWLKYCLQCGLAMHKQVFG